MTRADREVPAGHPVDPASRVVLGPDEIARALRRIAHEILESNRGADDLVLPGPGSAAGRRDTVGRRAGRARGRDRGRTGPVVDVDESLSRGP